MEGSNKTDASLIDEVRNSDGVGQLGIVPPWLKYDGKRIGMEPLSPPPQQKPMVWQCTCGKENTGAVCSACGGKNTGLYVCRLCAWRPLPGERPARYCGACGAKYPQEGEIWD